MKKVTRNELLKIMSETKAMVVLNEVAKKYGYGVRAFKSYAFRVEVNQANREQDFLPQIYFEDVSIFDEENAKHRFGVNMGCFGTLYGEKMDEWLAAQQAGANCATELTEAYKTLTADDFFCRDEYELID